VHPCHDSIADFFFAAQKKDDALYIAEKQKKNAERISFGIRFIDHWLLKERFFCLFSFPHFAIVRDN